jgi:hypothetical protein
MAVEGTKTFDVPLRPPTKAEQFDASPRGQELQTIFQMITKGDPNAEQAYQAYRQKYGVASPSERYQQRMQQRMQGQDGLSPPPMGGPPGANQ